MSKKPMIVDTALRNTLQHLQQDPWSWFGCYHSVIEPQDDRHGRIAADR